MDIQQREVRGVVILDLFDRFVLEDGVNGFVERMNTLIRQRRTRILLNFDRVTYLDSAGVGAIAWKYVTAKQQNCDVKLLNLRPKTFTVLETTKLLTVIRSFDSEEEAIESFALDHKDDDEDVDPIFT
jgi:anti-sigma B factor antagonist